MNGAFPDGFYCSTNFRTQVKLKGEWVDVEDQEMDCGIVVDPEGGDGAVRSDDRREDRRPHRRRAGRDARVPARRRRCGGTNCSSSWRVRFPASSRRRSACEKSPPRCGQTRGGRQGARGTRPGGRPHRGRANWSRSSSATASSTCCSPGNALAHARHGASVLRHEPGRLARQGPSHRRRPRTPPADDQHDPPVRRASRQAVEGGKLKSGIMYECVDAKRPVRAGRKHPRRRPAAGSDYRHARGSGRDAAADPRRRVLPDGGNDAALGGGRATCSRRG